MQQDELCSGLFSRSHMSNIESGRYAPGTKLLAKVAKRLNIPEAYLTQYDQLDDMLGTLLKKYSNALDTFELVEAERLRSEIEQRYPQIPSIVQETHFFLLESCYWVKKSQIQQAQKVFFEEFITLINESRLDMLPTYLQEKYYYMKAIIAYYQHAFVEALQHFSKQHTLAINNYQKAASCYNLANVHYRLYDLSNARSYATTAYDLYVSQNLWEQAVDALVLLGITFWELRSFQKAESKLHLASELIHQHVHTRSSDRLARVYHNLGLIYKDKGDLETAIQLLNQSIQMKLETNESSLCLTYLTLVNTFLQQGLVDQAQRSLLEAEACLPEKDRYFNALFFLTKAKVHLYHGQMNFYESLMKEAIKILQTLFCWKELLKATEELGDFYHRSRKYKLAADYYKLSINASKYLYAYEKLTQQENSHVRTHTPSVNVPDGPLILTSGKT